MCEEINRLETEFQELTPEQKLEQLKLRLWSVIGQMIRESARQEQYLSLTDICVQTELERNTTLDLMAEMREQEEYNDIFAYAGAKDTYYYTYPTLAHNYVKNLVLAQEDDLPRIIAETVRYESKTYPRATNIDTFSKYPYHYTTIQIKRMLERMRGQEAYQDLQTYESKNKNFYIFSTLHLSPSYASYLVEFTENKWNWL